MTEKNRPFAAIDAAKDIQNVAETLNVLHDGIVAADSFDNFPVGSWEILNAVLPKQIKDLDSIGMSLAREYEEAEYEPVLSEPEEEVEETTEIDRIIEEVLKTNSENPNERLRLLKEAEVNLARSLSEILDQRLELEKQLKEKAFKKPTDSKDSEA